MTLPLIVRPLACTPVAALSSAGSGLDNLRTPDPKEAFLAAGAGQTVLTVDFGALVSIDTVLLGFTNLPAGVAIELFAGQDFAVPIGTTVTAGSYRAAPARHAFAVLAPVQLRYLRLRVAAAGARLVAGVVAAGRALRPSSGIEQDWGRPVADTSTVTRLPGGGFGVDRGTTTGGLSWTMPALTDEERDRLYALQLDLGIGDTLLVLEQTTQGPAANEAVHWSKLTKLEPFARQAPGESKWAWQVQDWA